MSDPASPIHRPPHVLGSPSARLGDSGLRCPECDYNLTGVLSALCPECGWKIDRSLEPVHPGSHAAQRGLTGLLTLMAGLLSCAGAIILFVSYTPRDTQAGALTYELITFLSGAAHLAIFFVALRLRLDWPLRMSALPMVCLLLACLQIIASLSVVVAQSFSPSRGAFDTAVLLGFFATPGWVLLVARHVAFHAVTRGHAPVRRDAASPAAPPSGAGQTAPFIVDAVGPFAPGCVIVTWTQQARPSTPLLEALIEQTWREKLDSAARAGQLLYNGGLTRLVELSSHAGPDARRVLTLAAGPTDYRDFVGTNLYNAHLLATLGREHFANPIGTTATVVTSDGYLLYGRRNRQVAYHGGYLHTFGGGLEPGDRDDDGSFDVFAALRRELREELHLADADVDQMLCTGVIRDIQIQQPEVLFDVPIHLPRREVLERWDPDAAHQEHSAIESCRDEPDAIVPFVNRCERIAAVAIAAMLLHGRLNWGQDWYENAAYLLFGDVPAESPTARH